MKTSIRIINLCLVIVLLCMTITLCAIPATASASAATYDEEQTLNLLNEEESAVPFGLFCDVSAGIHGIEEGREGYVTGTARVNVAVLVRNIKAVVELYSSLTYQESYLQMQPEARATSNDLKQGMALSASAPINGVVRYWVVKMYYSVDRGDWKTVVTKPCRFDEKGIYLLP